MKLTFLNLTDAPGLGRTDLKKVRGHVTKVNFKRRSQRLKMANEQGKHLQNEAMATMALAAKQGEPDVQKWKMTDLFSIQSPPEPDREIRYCEYLASYFTLNQTTT